MATRVLIAGYYGFGNLGDEAILQVLISDLEKSLLEIAPVVISDSPSETSAQFEVEAVSWKDSEEIGRKIRNSHALIIGGGGLFHDYWPPKVENLLTNPRHGLVLYANLIAQAQLLQIPVLAYGIGVGPLRTPQGRDLASAILRHCYWIGLRDEASSEALSNLGIKLESSTFSIGTDLAIRHPAIQQAIDGIGHDKSSTEMVLAVNLRYWEFESDPNTIAETVVQALDAWLSQSNGRVVFVPFQSGQPHLYENDLEYAYQVASNILDQDNVSVEEPTSFFEAAHIFEQASFSITSRYHASLASLCTGIPTLMLSYDPKLDQLASDFDNMNHVISLSKLKADQLGKFLAEASILGEGSGNRTATIRATQKRGKQSAELFVGALDKAVASRPAMNALADISHKRLLQGQASSSWLLESDIDRWVSIADVELPEIFDRLLSALRIAEHEMDAQRQSVEDLEAEIEKLNLKQEISENQLEQMRHELSGIRSTFGFKLLSFYWRYIRFLLPAGTERRRLALSLNKAFKKVASQLLPVRILSGSSGDGAGSRADWLFEHRKRLNHFAQSELSSANRAAVIVAPTPFDPAQGQRSVNLADELARRGVPVLFAYWRWSLDDRPNTNSPSQGIFQIPLDLLLQDHAEILAKFNCDERWLICEFPYWELFELVAAAHGDGWIVIYDLIDDWSAFKEAGQAPWYRKEFEEHLLTTADLVLASSMKLLEAARLAGVQDPILLPNAASRWVRQEVHPAGQQRNGTILGYFGNLSPAWFDWSLMIEIAKRRPSWKIELIGPIPGDQPSRLPANIQLLGSVKQESLAQFAASWAAGLAPFKPGPLAEAVDAIKIYEYLALGLPVIISGISPPIGSQDFVIQADGADEYIHQVEQVKEDQVAAPSRTAYAAANSWESRVDELIQIMEQGRGRLQEKEALFEK